MKPFLVEGKEVVKLITDTPESVKKLRIALPQLCSLRPAFGTPKEELEARALADEKVKPFLEGKQAVTVIATR